MEFSGPIKTVRLFIALPISNEVKKRCQTLQQVGKEKGPSVRWVNPEQIHLTLVFLGWTDPALQERIEEAIQETAPKCSRFQLRIAGLGVYPKIQAPRVIWAGISEEASLTGLQEQLARRIGLLGIPVEKRPYRPHLTLGRIREGAAPDLFSRWVIGERDREIGRCEATEVALMESRPAPGGSVYSTLFKSMLGVE